MHFKRASGNDIQTSKIFKLRNSVLSENLIYKYHIFSEESIYVENSGLSLLL